ncbi:alpha/beta hydrolase [Pedobacter sp.]|uniref:alpha/beta hydrolase n=1 Tax=Pedobacter sp. TaxID=1411316 RepID=UPI003D7FFEE8
MYTFFKNSQLVSRILFTFLLIFFAKVTMAASVDTVATYSESMKKKITAVVILPEGYSEKKRYPTVYLLHGYGGNYADYIKKTPAIKDYADQYQMIIVCADGRNSWYFDSPVDSTWKYETYVSNELVGWIDQRYHTIADRKGRAIMGLSMGGHGALSLAIKHQDVFGAAGSMSGGLDLRPFPGNWEIYKRLGNYASNSAIWKENSVMEMIPLLSTNQLALLIDCGEDDFFYPVNLKFHEQLKYNNINHDFISRPGNHDWKYWKNAIGYQFLFFNNFFKG